VRPFRIPLAFLVVALALIASACGSTSESTPTQPAGTGAGTVGLNPCGKDQLQLVNPGQLTIATDNPAFPPWFQDAKGNPWDPTKAPTGLGYEAGVAYDVADQLGFSKDEVKWVVVPFNNIFKPGPKNFDFDINQVSYTPKRAQVVDFSDSYYDVEQAVVTLKSSKYATATSLADLKDAKFGAQVGTTSLDAINEVVQPNDQPNVYDTNNDAISALKNGQIDALVVDFPSTGYITGVQVPSAKVVGRLPAQGGEHFGLVFAKGNPLVNCANQALATLHQDGTIDQLAQKWIAGSAPAVLQ
jgi:polar amino acid transport system substrate-binding protein